jgi:hypothetical protein
MISGALAVTLTTGQEFGRVKPVEGWNEVNGGNNGRNPCDLAGPAAHNPNCQ